MESKVLDIELVKDGLDLYFSDKNTAVQFLSFLQAVVPMRTKTSRKLVSEDRQNNVHRSQWSMAVEIVPLCKGDLLLLLPGGGRKGRRVRGGAAGVCVGVAGDECGPLARCQHVEEDGGIGGEVLPAASGVCHDQQGPHFV